MPANPFGQLRPASAPQAPTMAAGSPFAHLKPANDLSAAGTNTTLRAKLSLAGQKPAPPPQSIVTRAWNAASRPIGLVDSGINQAFAGLATNGQGVSAIPANFRKGVQAYNQGRPVTVSADLQAAGMNPKLAAPVGAFLQGFENPFSYALPFKAAGAAAEALGATDIARAAGKAALETPLGRQVAGLFSNTAGVPQALVRLGERFKSNKNETLRTVQPILNNLEGSFKGSAAVRESAKNAMAVRLSQDQALESSLGTLPRNQMVRIVSKALRVPPEQVASLPHSDLEDLTRQAFTELASEMQQRGTAQAASSTLRGKVVKGGIPTWPELQALQAAVQRYAGPTADVTKMDSHALDQVARQALHEHFEPQAMQAGQQAQQKANDALQSAYQSIKADVDRNFLANALGPKKHLIRAELEKMSQPEIDALVKDTVAHQAATGGETYADVARRVASARGINLDQLIQQATVPVEEHASKALQDMVWNAIATGRNIPEEMRPLVQTAAGGTEGVKAALSDRGALLSRFAGGVKALARQGIAEAPRGKPNAKLLAEARAVVRQATGAKATEVRKLSPQDLADLLQNATADLKNAHPIASMTTAQRYEELAKMAQGASPEDIYRRVTNLLPAVEAGKTVEYAPRTGYFHHTYEATKPLQRVPSGLTPEAAAVRSSAAGYTPRAGFTKEQVLTDIRAAQQWAQAHGLKLVTDPVKSLSHRLERSVHATHAQDFLESVRNLAGTPEGEGVVAPTEQAPLGWQELPEVSGLKGYALSPEATRYIRNLVTPKPGASPIEKVVDSLLGGIRHFIFYNPLVHGVTNLAQNTYVAGFNELDPRNWGTISRAAHEIKTEGPAFRQLRRAGAYLDTFGSANSLAQEAARSAGHLPSTQRMNPLRWLHDLTWGMDKLHRTALGMHLMQQGATAEQAAVKVRQALGYPDLSDFEKQVLSRMFLAYPWMKGNLVFQAIAHVTSPERVQVIRSLADAVNATATGHGRSQNAPGYQQGIVLPVKDKSGKNLVIRNLPGPAKDLEELVNQGPSSFLANRLTPPLRLGVQEATGKVSPFNPADTRLLNPPGVTVPLFGYGRTGFGPQVTPGQQAAAAMLGAPQGIGEQAGSTPTQQALSAFGVHANPYDPGKAYRGRLMDENTRMQAQLKALQQHGVVVPQVKRGKKRTAPARGAPVVPGIVP